MDDPGAEQAGRPGWYPAPDGRLFWWDGTRWAATPSGSDSAPVDPAIALLPHLGMFVMPVVGALVLRLTVGQRDAFVRHHASEALNLQIWFAIVWNAAGIPVFAYAMSAMGANREPSITVFVGTWILLMVIALLTAALSVIGAVKAHRREWWRCPVTPVRFVRGAADPRGSFDEPQSRS